MTFNIRSCKYNTQITLQQTAQLNKERFFSSTSVFLGKTFYRGADFCVTSRVQPVTFYFKEKEIAATLTGQAITRFFRLFRDKSPQQAPQYLLLFRYSGCADVELTWRRWRSLHCTAAYSCTWSTRRSCSR